MIHKSIEPIEYNIDGQTVLRVEGDFMRGCISQREAVIAQVPMPPATPSLAGFILLAQTPGSTGNALEAGQQYMSDTSRARQAAAIMTLPSSGIAAYYQSSSIGVAYLAIRAGAGATVQISRTPGNLATAIVYENAGTRSTNNGTGTTHGDSGVFQLAFDTTHRPFPFARVALFAGTNIDNEVLMNILARHQRNHLTPDARQYQLQEILSKSPHTLAALIDISVLSGPAIDRIHPGIF